MANITVIGPDWTITSSLPERLSEYEVNLCLQILLYLSASIGSPLGTLNSNLGCIPLKSYPGSIVTKLVVTSTAPDVQAIIAPYFYDLAARPMDAIGGTVFASSFNVANASGVIIYSPPPPSPPPSPSPPSPLPPPSPIASPSSSGISPGVAGVAGVLVILAVVVVSVNAFLFMRARAFANQIKKDLNAPALRPPRIGSKRFQVEQLPNIISAHHVAMPSTLAAAPMRLLHIKQVLEWPNGLKVFEEVDTSTDCLVIPYNEISEEQWAMTMVLTWRW